MGFFSERTTRPASLLIALALASTSCGATRRRRLGHEPPHVKGIRIIDGATARREKLVGQRHVLRFGRNQDGTQLVLDFLEQAKRAGARYVSDIRIELAVKRRGERRRCSTRLVPFPRGMRVPVKHTIPGRTVTRRVPKLVTRTVTEQVYVCRSVSRPVTRYVTRYESRYDYSSRSYRSVPVSRAETRYESRQQCRHQPRTRTVSRYEYQLQTRYIPPQVRIIAKRFTDMDLLESKPVCTLSAEKGATRLPHRIVGTIYKGR